MKYSLVGAGPSLARLRYPEIEQAPSRPGYTYLSAVITVFLFSRLVWFAVLGDFGSTPLDEILAVSLIPAAVLGVFYVGRSASATIAVTLYAGYFVLFVLSGMFAGIQVGRSAPVVLYGISIEAKWLIVILAATYFAGKYKDAEKILHVVIVSCFAIAMLNCIPVILDIFGNGVSVYGDRLIRRGPLFQPQGFFQHPVASVHVTLFGYIAALCLKWERHQTTLRVCRLILLVILVLHGVTKEVFAIAAVTALYVANNRYINLAKKYVVLVLLLGVVVIGLLAFGSFFIDRLLFYVSDDADGTVRRLLYSASLQVGWDYFPLGTGPSSFASDGARTGTFSGLYSLYGIYGAWGATYDNSSFLVDVFWPKILAESGFLGTIFYVGFIATPSFTFIRFWRHLNSAGRFCMFVYVAGLISSVGSPNLNSELYATIFFTCFGLTFYPKAITVSSEGPAPGVQRVSAS